MRTLKPRSKQVCSLFMLLFATTSYALPSGFVYLHNVAPGVLEDMRYATSNNFTGAPLPGYQRGRCILTAPAAKHLAKAQKMAMSQGYRIKVYDCYRPQSAVNAFYRWSQNTADQRTKQMFYPREEKNQLFAKGYIAKNSGHTRGSTVDLTLVPIHAHPPSKHSSTVCYGHSNNYLNDNSINTGTRFDCLDPSASVFYQDITQAQKNNRLLLRNIMVKNGFKPYDKEWWHFTLDAEPFPEKYFNFPVK